MQSQECSRSRLFFTGDIGLHDYSIGNLVFNHFLNSCVMFADIWSQVMSEIGYLVVYVRRNEWEDRSHNIKKPTHARKNANMINNTVGGIMTKVEKWRTFYLLRAPIKLLELLLKLSSQHVPTYYKSRVSCHRQANQHVQCNILCTLFCTLSTTLSSDVKLIFFDNCH